MPIKRNFALFFMSLFSSLSIAAGFQDVVANVIHDFYRIWGISRFFSLIEVFGLGRVSSLLFVCIFACVVVIQAYTVHRLLKVPCTKAVPRMILINVACEIITLLLIGLAHKIYPLKAIDLWLIFLWSILLSIAIFAVRVLVSSKFFSWFDPSLHKKALTRAMIFANVFTVLFLLACFMVQDHAHYARVMRFDRQKFDQLVKMNEAYID